jgi:hypothetical protein
MKKLIELWKLFSSNKKEKVNPFSLKIETDDSGISIRVYHNGMFYANAFITIMKNVSESEKTVQKIKFINSVKMIYDL